MNPKRPPGRALAEDLTVTVEQAAALLGVSRNGAYNAIREGSIPSIRVGRAIRIPTHQLKRLLGLPEEPPRS